MHQTKIDDDDDADDDDDDDDDAFWLLGISVSLCWEHLDRALLAQLNKHQ